MKLKNIYIEEYKNIKKNTFDFSNHTNYAALVGLNGSGKSNLLEAISSIFASVYNNSTLDWKYKLEYIIGNDLVSIENGSIKANEEKVEIKDKEQFLPNRIIACYSGEEKRMWEDIYKKFYDDFLKGIKKNKLGSSQKLIYINKYSWDIALIALLCHENSKQFVKDTFRIDDISKVTVDFTFNEKKLATYKDNEVIDFVNRLIEESKLNKGSPLSINFIGSLNLKERDNLEFSRLIYYYLYTAAMPKEDKILELKVNFNNIDVKKLSEGEKKLLLIKCIMDILSDERSLVLLDEPDAHLHISRKKEIKNLIDKADYFTVFTTHSPVLLNSLHETNITILNIKNGKIEIIPAEKAMSIRDISGGEMSLVDATLALTYNKDILLVEGKYDYFYITKAVEQLNKIHDNKYSKFDFLIINCGGADNVEDVFSKIHPYLKSKQLCVCILDDDVNGRASKNKIEGKKLKNVKVFCHPKIDGWTKDDFLMEDYFPVDSYKSHYADIVNAATSRHGLDKFEKPKDVIWKNYEHFTPEQFNNFQILVDKIISTQTQFHKK